MSDNHFIRFFKIFWDSFKIFFIFDNKSDFYLLSDWTRYFLPKLSSIVINCKISTNTIWTAIEQRHCGKEVKETEGCFGSLCLRSLGDGMDVSIRKNVWLYDNY